MRRRATRDAHPRFAEWLLAGGDEELPRDVAVHAYVCRECQKAALAFDVLTAVDLARAGMPPAARVALRRRHPVRRAAFATGGALAATAVAAVATGTLRLPGDGGLVGVPTASERAQGVLGNTGTPEPSAESPQASPPASRRPRPVASVPPPLVAPTVAPPPAPAASATPLPRATATLRPRPSSRPGATPVATPTPVGEPSATATATPPSSEESPSVP